MPVPTIVFHTENMTVIEPFLRFSPVSVSVPPIVKLGTNTYSNWSFM